MAYTLKGSYRFGTSFDSTNGLVVLMAANDGLYLYQWTDGHVIASNTPPGNFTLQGFTNIGGPA